MRFSFLIFLLCQWALGQQVVKHFDTSNGLVHDVTYGLFQDSKGYVWIGTDDGLMKFDGNEFRAFTIDDGFRTNYAIDITEDHQQNIVVATWGGGLHFIKHDIVVKDTLTPNYELQINNIDRWGKKLISNTATRNMIYQGDENPYVEESYSVVEKKGKLLLEEAVEWGSSLGNFAALGDFLYVHDAHHLVYPPSKTLKGVYWVEKNKILTPVFPFLNNQYIDYLSSFSPGEYVAASENTLYLFNNKRIFHTYSLPLESKLIIKVIKTASQKLFILAADRNGFKEAYLYDPQAQSFLDIKKEYAIAAAISDILEDHEGNLWLSTFGEGVYCIETNVHNIKFIGSDVLTDTNIQGIEEKKDTIYLLTPGQVLLMYQQQKIDSINLIGFGKGILNFNNSILVSSLHKGKNSTRKGVKEIRGINLFNVDSLGLIIYSDSLEVPKMKKVYGNQKKNKKAAVFYQDTLLFATGNGLFYLDFKKDTLIEKRISPPLLSTQLSDFQKVSEGLYIASMRGLDYLSNTQRKTFTEKEGLISDNIKTLMLDHRGNIWIGTPKGVSVFDGTHFTSFGKNEGLLSSHANVIFEDSKHQVWISGNDGISILDNTIPLQKTPPPILTISQDGNTFQYHAISYNRSNALIVQYSLNHGEWVNLPASSGEFATENFKKGNYTLQFRARKQDGDWATSLQFPFAIVLPWYQNPFFYLIVSLLLFSLLTLLTLKRLKVVKKRNEELHLAISKQKELEKKLGDVRNNIAQDFHDDLGNKLARISLFSNMLLMESKNKENLKQKLSQITEDANYLYKGTRDFIFSLKEDSDYLEELVTYISDFGEDIFKNTSIKFRVEKALEENVKLPYYWSKQLIYIFKEALTNLLKHAEATEATLQFFYSNDLLTICCIDNGKGFSESHLKSNNGIQHMEQRAKKIGGKITISSIPEKETKITFTGKTTL
ncbi:MAG: two-component regulator propeller domain-containing protein [Flavobacteriaceae bacterium]